MFYESYQIHGSGTEHGIIQSKGCVRLCGAGGIVRPAARLFSPFCCGLRALFSSNVRERARGARTQRRWLVFERRRALHLLVGCWLGMGFNGTALGRGKAPKQNTIWGARGGPNLPLYLGSFEPPHSGLLQEQ